MGTRFLPDLHPGDRLAKYAGTLDILRDVLDGKVDTTELSDDELSVAVRDALVPARSDEEREERLRNWDPVELLRPEWDYLQQPSRFARQDAASGLMVTEMSRGPRLPGEIARVDALRRASRCSSDPVCGQRTPRHSEDFLHGAACHCCCFASETSCERANRFLDRRFLLTLPTVDDERVPGFFGLIDGS